MGDMNGCCLERGNVVAVQEGKYVVRSMTRDGVETPPIGALDGKEHQVGELVLFFMFPDGEGKILAGL